jgi:hypothetical protein
MDHFLTRLVARTLGEAHSVEPLIPSIYANASELGDERVDPQDEWREPSHEGLSIPRRPQLVGRLSREEDYSSPENKKNDRMGEAANPYMEKPDPSDSNESRRDNHLTKAKEKPSEENIVSWKPEYKLNRAKTVSRPSSETQRKGSAYFPPPMEDDSSKRLSPVSGGESHGSGRSLAAAFQTTGGETDDDSRSNVERQQRESRHLPQAVCVQTAAEDLLVPPLSTDHNPYAFTQAQPAPSGPPPNQVLGPRSSPPPTKVTIGRIEVRAVMRPEPRPSAAEPVTKKTGPALSLENYLRQRDRNRL